MRGYGLDFDLVRTERPWHAAELAQQACADGYDVVVAVGGDGTANEVLNGLMLARQAGSKTVWRWVCCVWAGATILPLAWVCRTTWKPAAGRWRKVIGA